SAALYQLARRGLRVLGIDRFPPGHDRGSSHGQTRVIRKAYFEHPNYVPLLQRAYENWHQLEVEAGQKLFERTGILEIGPPQGVLVPGVRSAARQYSLPLEELSPAEVVQRFPGFAMPEEHIALYEPDAGFLHVEACVCNYVALAKRHGGQLAIGQAVCDWRSRNGRVEVRSEQETYYADKLVVTAGAWAGELLAESGISFRVLRKHLHWYATPAYRIEQGSPVYFYETPDGCYYGFPSVDGRSTKVAEHSGGEPIGDPLQLDRRLDVAERLRVERFLRGHLSRVEIKPLDHAVCMYTMSADEHFVVDRHPLDPNVCFAAGLSGHGFKFASALGEILADWTQGKTNPLATQFLAANREGIRWHS
ncbi:MAG: N-methyl-L-tryptophan oxidase, partial [Planctomycetales bacterium]|nr:N-methyl-L-tryptophan oxidase [Planctomycetales bacterium]